VADALRALGATFRNPNLRRLLLAWAAASFSLWAFAIALGVYAYDVGGAAAVGIAALVRLLPGALASPAAGLLGDRHSRRAVLIGSTVAGTAVLALALAAIAADAPAGLVFALAGAFTVVTSPYVPAEGALLPVVSRTPQELSAANVSHSTMDNAGFLAGSILTGVLLAAYGPEAAFAAAAIASLVAAVLLTRLDRDERPAYASESGDGPAAQVAAGARALLGDSRLRTVAAVLTLLVLFEGAADVIVVILALDLLALGEGSVGFLNAAWGIGALAGGAALALLLDRGNLALGLLAGSLLTGASMALPGVWVAAAAAYLGWLGIGFGYTFVEVAARTLLQRLGDDETLARALAFLESTKLAAMALGSILVPAVIALAGIRGALIALGALLPALALVRWAALRALEIGAPVDEERYRLLRGNEIFAPLPVDALEGLARDLTPRSAAGGEEIVTQGDEGERFFLIAEGEVEVFRDGALLRTQGDGEAFGEIALLRQCRRTATVRAVRDTRLFCLESDRFIASVTGHRRSSDEAAGLADERLENDRQRKMQP
jgi:MFS family permease